jgi:23S rRNA (uracil1939-C5)-methyltransferase
VPKTIVGEKVEAVVIKDKSNFCNCSLSKIVNASRSRILPKCKYFDKCGGCQLQHLDYKSQLEIKKKTTQNTINKISKLNINITDILPSDSSFGYRNKMVFAIDEKGKLCMHDDNGNLFEVDHCHLANDGINKILSIVSQFIQSTQLNGYNKNLNKGFLRYLVVRQLNSQFLITLVSTKKEIPYIDNLQKMLDREKIKYGLFVNINNDKSSLILTDKFIHIAGLKTLTGEYICKNGKIIKYPISPLSFMQVNNYIKEKIYSMVEEVLHGEKLIIDAYSGAGLLTAILSQNADRVVGVEIVEQATQDANKLMKDNNITNIVSIRIIILYVSISFLW